MFVLKIYKNIENAEILCLLEKTIFFDFESRKN